MMRVTLGKNVVRVLAATALAIVIVGEGSALAQRRPRPQPAYPPGSRPPVTQPPSDDRRPGRPGQGVVTYPPRRGDVDDTMAYNLVSRSLQRADCNTLSVMMSDLQNQIVYAANLPRELPIHCRDAGRGARPDPECVRQRMGQQVRERLQSPRFQRSVWERLEHAYRSCGRTCFDDGYSVGMISGSTYCSMTVALQGLPDMGGVYHPTLPSCGADLANGCRSGFNDAIWQVPGCHYYSTMHYTGFQNQISQDCFL